MKRQRHDITPRDRDLLKLVARYRLATDELFRRAAFPEVQSADSVRKVSRRLVKRSYLREYLLGPNEPYYILAPRGARALGIKPKAPRPFTEQSLPGALAVAWYCVRTGVSRFTAEEFITHFPDLTRRELRSSGYFVEATQSLSRLGLFVTDRGTTPRRMLSKVRKVIQKRYAMRAFAALIQAGRFTIIILTGHERKQKEFEAAIERRHRGPAQVRVEVVPELGPLLTRLSRHEVTRRDDPRHARRGGPAADRQH
jgi:hypothetical protein